MTAGGPSGSWFNPIAAFLGRAYWAPSTTRVQAFTTGTEQEVEFLFDALALEPGMRLLDVGCGPGRHSLAFARRGLDVTGVDLSPDFVDLARAAARDEGLDHCRFEVADVRDLEARDFDAVICLCQGGFGLLAGDDGVAFARIAAALCPGGRLALSAFSSYFAVRHLEADDTFDAATGVNHERATLRNEHGEERAFDLWTTCFTPRELELLARLHGLVVDGCHGVSPGAYARTPPTLATHESLLLAHRPLAPST
ncbi:MAG TPA: class I SAM-dependent methyltransferase [Acidimicrobiia bacterium]|nr:class I SAM-dependent methyltransferase [Acidimicrobiia bacterium]